MKPIRTFLLAACTAAALVAHTSAQQITASDRAIVDTMLEACAPQIAAMKKELAAHGEFGGDAEMRQFFESMPAELRMMADMEGMSLLDAVRGTQARIREMMNDPASSDPSMKVAAPSMLCLYDLLIERETGGSAPAPDRAAPPLAPAPPPAPAVSSPAPINDRGGCLIIDWRGGVQGDPALLSNGCSHALNVGVCISGATAGSPSEQVSCEQSRFTTYFINGRSSVTVPATHGLVTWRVCTAPQFPALWWENGRSIGNCR